MDDVLDAEAVAIEREQLRELLEGEINEKAQLLHPAGAAQVLRLIPRRHWSATVIWTRWTA